ncbi:MAG: carbohydrate binding family 9 domain-containing protein [Acidobacteriia bacterium]|nr:carbohydrate binding family 9 domain-containing protein [Terriglobia bacterium]
MRDPLKVLLLIGVLCSAVGMAQNAPQPNRAKSSSTLIIPRLARAPALEEFLSMHPEGEVATAMAKVSGFVQRDPHGGQPASQPTEAYLGYDQKNLYVVFVCFDDPGKVRARMSRREDIFSDDNVEIMLDTFHDRRRAYAFQTNPLGVQWDAIWTEIPHEDSNGNLNNFDSSFDTVWSSRGKLTSQGYVVWMAIPFKSLRFSPQHEQSWGLILYRGILRDNEDDFWPEISRRVEGRLGQAATANGMEKISPGRNMQFIPYGALRSFHAPDANRSAEFRGGLDSKFIIHDNLVLDVTANPDFSQVESDEPQITVNQRFEVFFPEKRPFFLENADYFKTPIDLFFTRNIGDPQFGARLTGKVGPYSLGILSSDDRGPGNSAPVGSPLVGDRATFNIARVSRDIFRQSSVGAIYTDRELPGANEFNRIGGIDGRLKFDPNWTETFQGVVSSTQNQDGSYQAGPAYKGDVTYNGTNLDYEATYNDISPGFTTDAGFVNRVDIREIKHQLDYRFRPSSGPLLSWGPDLFTDHVWAHDGTRLDTLYDPDLAIQLKGQTYIHLTPYVEFRERLRPSDFPTLTQNQDFHEHNSSVSFGTSYLPKVAVQGYYQFGDGVNFVPPANQVPVLAKADSAQLSVSFLPITNLKVDNLYLFDRLRDRASGASVFNNHIVRSKWNWQFNRELSVRVILQYTATLANPAFTSLTTSKEFNADFLITYLLHPGTAIYVGYNSDLQNNNGPRYINDSRQFFVKVSYLFRF